MKLSFDGKHCHALLKTLAAAGFVFVLAGCVPGGTFDEFAATPGKGIILSADKRAIIMANRVNADAPALPAGNATQAIALAALAADEATSIDPPDAYSDVFVCAEPQPDAIRAVAQEFAAALTAEQSNTGKASGELSATAQEAVASLGRRTPTTQLMRDALYRTCEGVINGVLTVEHTEFVAGQLDNLMVGLHAIDGLTQMGAASLAVVVASPGTSSPSTGDAAEITNGAATAVDGQIINARSEEGAAPMPAAGSHAAIADAVYRIVQLVLADNDSKMTSE